MYGNEVFDDMTDDEIWEAFSVSGLYTKYAKRYTVRTMVPDGVPMYSLIRTYVRKIFIHSPRGISRLLGAKSAEKTTTRGAWTCEKTESTYIACFPIFAMGYFRCS